MLYLHALEELLLTFWMRLATWLHFEYDRAVPIFQSPSTADEAWYWPKCILHSGWLYITSRQEMWFVDCSWMRNNWDRSSYLLKFVQMICRKNTINCLWHFRYTSYIHTALLNTWHFQDMYQDMYLCLMSDINLIWVSHLIVTVCVYFPQDKPWSCYLC